MTTGTTHKLRALLLTVIMVTSIVGGGVAFAGSAAASDFEGLNASDGNGGDESTLVENFDHQLPRGTASGNDTLRVDAENGTLPEFFRGELRVGSGDVSINTSQDVDDIELVIIGENETRTTAANDDNVFVDVLKEGRIEFQVYYNQQTPVFGEEESPVAVKIANLSFDANGQETVPLTWEIDNTEADHTLNVTAFQPDLSASDGDRAYMGHVTAGTQDKAMAGPEGSSTLVLDGDETAFPDTFTVNASLDDENVNFSESLEPENITAESSYGDVTVQDVSSSEIEFKVKNFDSNSASEFDLDGGENVVLSADGVTFDTRAGATDTDLVWEVRGATDTFTLRPDYLTADFSDETYEIPRGGNQQPENGAELVIAADNVQTEGLHDYDFPMYVDIPAEKQGEITFDQSAAPETSLTDAATVTVKSETRLVIDFDQPPWESFDDGDSVTVSGIRFNTSGASEPDDETLQLSSGLDVEYAPESGLGGFVSIDSERESVDADVPDVSSENHVPTMVNINETGTTGSSPLIVNITDTTGDQMQPGSKIVVGLPNADGLRFQAGQEMQTDGTVGFSAGTIEEVHADRIVIEIPEGAPEASQQGEYLLLAGPDGHGITFDTTNATVGESAQLTVQTSVDGAAITQQTGTVVEVTDGPSISSRPNAIPASGGDVEVQVADPSADDLTGIQIESSVAGVGTETTDQNGVATFENVSLENTGNKTIPFTASINGTEYTTHVTSIGPRITAEPGVVQVGERTAVDVTLETYETGTGYVGDGSNVTATAAPYSDDVVKQTATDSGTGVTTFEINLTEEDEDGHINFSAAPNGIDLDTTVVAASDGDIETEQSTLALGQNHENVEVAVYDIDGEPQPNVTVTAQSDALNLNESAETDQSGTASLSIDLSEADAPATIDLHANLGDDAAADEANGTIETVVMRPADPAVVPVGNETPITIDIDGSDGVDVENINVSTTADDTDYQTDADGSTTIPVHPEKTELIGFEATVDGVDLAKAVETVNLVTNTSRIAAGNETTVEAEVRHSNTTVDPSGYEIYGNKGSWINGDNPKSTQYNGTVTFDLAPDNEATNETIRFNTTVEGYELDADVKSVVPRFEVSPKRIYVGAESDIDVRLEAWENGGMTGQDEKVTVDADGYDVDSESKTTNNGDTTFTADLTNATEEGQIGFSTTVNDIQLDTSATVASPNVDVENDSLTVNETGQVNVTITGDDGDGLNGYDVAIEGDLEEGNRTATTDANGEVNFEVTPKSEEPVVVTVDTLEFETSINVSAKADDDGSEGGGGEEGDGDNGGETDDGGDSGSGTDDGTDTGGNTGGGGGGAAPAPSPSPSTEFNVTDVNLSANEVEVGDKVNVTATVANEGDANGEYDVQVKANTVTVENETVTVAAGETVEVTLSLCFRSTGKRMISVDGVKGGKIVVSEIEPEGLPESTTAADAQPVIDVEEDVNAPVVAFDENVTVDAIAFSNASDGTATVADLEALPENLSVTPGELVQAMEITVPDELENESATIRLSLSAEQYEGDPDRIRLARFHEDSWQILAPESVEESDGELVYEFETPGFSTFAVFAQETEDPQTTSTPQSTADTNETDTGGSEEAGMGTLGLVAIAFIAVIAALLAAAGARMYRQNKR